MTFVITGTCCNDASCVPACPVNCIHPAPGEPGYMTSEQLYIDPETCIECSACAQVCPVNAIYAEEDLTTEALPFTQINADYYKCHPMSEFGTAPVPRRPSSDVCGLKVAVVGSGPAGSYAAAELLGRRGVEVDVYERLFTPYGLVRSGVAPDHAATKDVVSAFPYDRNTPDLHLHLGVEVGKDISHAELLRHHHAVIYAVGAATDRRLGIPGEDLPGSHPATDFVAWYNGHPDFADCTFDLGVERAIVVGNGNVALDVARTLCGDPEILARTDIADHALEALRASKIREVVVLGRRSLLEAAFTTSELIGLMNRADIELAVDIEGFELDASALAVLGVPQADPAVQRKAELARTIAARAANGGGRKITLRFLVSPVEILGDDQVRGIRVVHNERVVRADGTVVAEPSERTSVLEAGLVLRSVGYRGTPISGLPFDAQRGVVPNEDGRVVAPDSGRVAGAYVTGWVKRGPSGLIGTNRECAKATVASLFEDYVAGKLTAPVAGRESIEALIQNRLGADIGVAGWSRIDAAERAAGEAEGRPRVKLVQRDQLRAAAEGLVTTVGAGCA